MTHKKIMREMTRKKKNGLLFICHPMTSGWDFLNFDTNKAVKSPFCVLLGKKKPLSSVKVFKVKVLIVQ